MSDDSRWHLKRGVSLGNAVTAGAAVFSVIVWLVALQISISKLEVRQDAIDQRMDREYNAIAVAIIEIKTSLRRIEDSLAKKVDKP